MHSQSRPTSLTHTMIMTVLRALPLIALLMLGACSREERRVDQGNRDGILHFGNGTEPQDLDPQTTTGLPESHLHYAMFEGLVSKDPSTLEPVPGVAERWEVSDDRLTYTFHLRDDAKWSNGEPLTAEDFRWSWWRALQPKLGNEYAYMMFSIVNAENYFSGEISDFSQVGVHVLDDHTLEVKLSDPIPYFLQLLDHHTFFPVSRKVLEQHDGVTNKFSGWTRPGHMVGNGPFRLLDWKLNRYVKVEKNPYYWDAAKVRLNGIVFYPTENIVTEERLFRSGQLHRTEYTPLDKLAEYRRDHPELLHTNLYLGSYYFMANTTRPPLNDARVRRALALAIDRQTLINNTLNGANVPSTSLTPPGTLGYQPPQLFSFDPVAARKLLAEAGYPDGKGFPRIEFLYNTMEQHRKVAVAVQQMWKQYLNIDIGLINQEWKVYLDSRNQKHFDICRAAWIGDYVDPDTFLTLWITDGGNNNTGWSNKEYDDLIQRKIPAMKTREERLAGFYQAETILLNEMPIIPIYTYTTQHLFTPNVKGIPFNLMDYYSFKNIYLEGSP